MRPETLTLIRHDVSTYNDTKEQKANDPVFRAFNRAFAQDPTSSRTRDLATYIQNRYALGTGDSDTPLKPTRETETSRSEIMASKLKNIMPLPDVIFVSPYLRTKQTLE